MTSVFNTDASLPYNHDLFESLIVKKRIKMDGEGTYCCLTTVIPRCLHLQTFIQAIWIETDNKKDSMMGMGDGFGKSASLLSDSNTYTNSYLQRIIRGVTKENVAGVTCSDARCARKMRKMVAFRYEQQKYTRRMLCIIGLRINGESSGHLEFHLNAANVRFLWERLPPALLSFVYAATNCVTSQVYELQPHQACTSAQTHTLVRTGQELNRAPQVSTDNYGTRVAATLQRRRISRPESHPGILNSCPQTMSHFWLIPQPCSSGISSVDTPAFVSMFHDRPDKLIR
ncbi:hypothetical protein CLF_109637 [Clonorchis sinensis]|uniref:Uncharacterized protein n=1 Tax=Clonorchis sinensis TaxID=79923 RepID=G7YST1_CLOSI|nr:hypothetical protein CLF_109637 [Clonorchis sinensis]